MKFDAILGIGKDRGLRKRAALVCVRSLLSGDARYCADPNGRGYVWGAPEIAQLLLDLESGAATDAPRCGDEAEQLYLGVIAAGAAKPGIPGEIVDGQQRLTAIMLFLAFARDRLSDGGARQRVMRLLERRRLFGAAEPRLVLAPADNPWFAAHILQPRATLRLPADAPDGGPKRLLSSARFMQRAFAGYSAEDIRRITNFLLDRAAFVVAEPAARTAAIIEFPAARTRALPQPAEETPKPLHGMIWVDDDQEDEVALFKG